MSELLIGCGTNREKKLARPSAPGWTDLTTLDFCAAHKPDVLHDLSSLPLPFDDDSFDEVHAYDVLEHVGQQGDWRFFFDQWNDFYRLLKPGGYFCGISPHYTSPWAWGDPGHTRVITLELITFLHRPAYEIEVGNTPRTDYRFCYYGDFDILMAEKREADLQFAFVLEAVKPARG